MARKIRKVMEALHQVAAGLDVHKATVMACRRRLLGGDQAESEVRQFRTTMSALRELRAWLAEWGVTHVALESTGVYWVPVWNVLEGQVQLRLINPTQLKKVPGRKDDVPDAEWIAQCEQCGLLTGSFVPSAEVRHWRQLTRQRTKLVDQRTSVINRLHSVLHQGNIKLSEVASDIMGVSCRKILRSMSDGETDPARLAALAQGRLRAPLAELVESLEGLIGEREQWLLKHLLDQIGRLEEEIERWNQRIGEQMRPYEKQLQGLETIGGVGRRSAENLLAEVGVDMSVFPTDDHLVSWGGMCPGREASGGKNRSSRRPHGNKWLRRALSEAAWGASHEKDSYLSALYRRLAPHRNRKRAIIAVGRTILQASWHILKEGVEYKDLGGDYFARTADRQKMAHYYQKQLERLGFEVEVKPKQAA